MRRLRQAFRGRGRGGGGRGCARPLSFSASNGSAVLGSDASDEAVVHGVVVRDVGADGVQEVGSDLEMLLQFLYPRVGEHAAARETVAPAESRKKREE